MEETALEVVSIEDGFEQIFWNHANLDPFDYYFFILDWKQRKEQTKIFLAMEENRLDGLMLVYSDYVVQLRGTRKAVESLLASVSLEKVELQAPLNCDDIVLRKYNPILKYELVLMRLNKGEENIQIKHSPVRLGVEDIEEFVEVLKNADSVTWGDLDAEKQRASWKDAFLLGIRRDNRLVSVGNARFVDFGSNIGAIATDERYRNNGYATSITSALVEEILKKSPAALIHVLSHNAPAVKVYSKVGFRPYKSYFFIRGKKAW